MYITGFLITVQWEWIAPVNYNRPGVPDSC